ncbi:nanos homolog 1-like [Leucoraja erinacea]|uniref:nanos homolog 1-like n=1 Tax=Leucoraja erinaceus TaxID=7782 RepID=UPI002457FF4B|nr:nanos homolog 1-like [Leucoraja erinacea]
MESLGSLDKQLEKHARPVDYLHQRYASSCENTFNSWNDYLGLTTLVSKAVNQAGQSGLHPGSELSLQSRAPYLARSLELSHLPLCSHHGDLLGSDLEERFAEFNPFSPGSSPLLAYTGGGEEEQQQLLLQQQRHHQPRHQHRLDREQVGWNRVDVIMMDDKSHLQLPHSHHHNNQHHHHHHHQAAGHHQRGARAKPELQICVFCRNNNESVTLYTTHILKSPDGRVLCPILRRYTCPLCGANGDNAHTIKYCPLSKLQPTIPKLKTRNCIGKRVR